jgi:competence protein ComEC
VPKERSPFQPENNGGTTFQFFTPTKCTQANINNHSIVTIVSHAGVKLLIPGDNEPPSWDELLGQAAFVQAIRDTHVLVAPHHGRDSGFHAPLIEKTQPRLVIISDGRFCDTSATDRYDKQASGLTVKKRAGGTETRKCVTTRSDGCIVLRVKPVTQGPPLEVTID